MKVDTVLFDLDETLIEEESANDASALLAGEIARERHGVDPAKLLRALRLRSGEMWRAGPALDYCRAIGISAREGLWGSFTGDIVHLATLREWIPGYREQAWTRALNDCGVDAPAIAREMAELFRRDRTNRHVLFEETLAVLDALQGRFRLGLITNGAPDIQRCKINGSNLAGYFDDIVVSGEIGVGKPHLDVFRHALDALESEAAGAVMIGDSIKRDVIGARDAGIKSIWVNRFGVTERPVLPDVEMIDLTGLPKLLLD